MAKLGRPKYERGAEMRKLSAEVTSRLDAEGGDDYGQRSWPMLEWRGDGQRRALTCGTILSIVSNLGGNWDDDNPGVDAATVVQELKRLAAKYDPNKDKTLEDKPVRGGDMLMVDARSVAETIANLCDISGVMRVANADLPVAVDGDGEDVYAVGDEGDEKEASRSNGETPRGMVSYKLTEGNSGSVSIEKRDVLLKLTLRGQERLVVMLSTAQGDKRFSHIDLADPILEYNPALDIEGTIDESTAEKAERERLVAAEAAMADALTPMKRHSPARPTYRLWMWIVKVSPQTYAYTVTDTDHDVVLTASNTAPGEPHEKCGVEFARAMGVRKFIDLVLSGGPDGIWTGKPLQPHTLHSDIEAFTAAGRAGFSEDIVKQSSMAWEMFDAADRPTTDYLNKRTMLKTSYDLRAQSTEIVPLAREGMMIEKSYQMGPRLYGPMRVEKEVHHAEKVVLKTTADALMDALVANSVGPDPESMRTNDWRAMARGSGQIDLPPKMRCGTVKPSGKQCGNWAVGGTGRCELHGGRLIDEDETRSLLRAQQVRIFSASGKALDTILYLMEHSANDAIRLRAAETVLNRGGLGERSEINLEVGMKDDAVRQDPGQIVRERLARLAGFDSADVFASPKQLTAVDAEVVEVEHDGKS